MFFRYFQLLHAFHKQFPPSLTLESDPVESLLIAKVIDKPLSSLYFCLSIAPTNKLDRTFAKWQVDIPDLTEEEWEDCLSSFVTNMISAWNRFLQIKFLHRAYFTPKRLMVMNPAVPVSCPRCSTQAASFLHMVWSCPLLDAYRLAVLEI